MKLDIKKLTEKAKKNDPKACLALGLEYYNGKLVEQNIPLAAKWIIKSLKLDILKVDGSAEEKINKLFYFGFEGDVNPKVNPYFVTGSLYSNIKDYKKAIEYFKEGYKKGSVQCCAALGSIYLNGLGVKKDENKGYEYTKQAMWTGYPPADFVWRVIKQRGIRPDLNKKN